jgi:hypothetical protein
MFAVLWNGGLKTTRNVGNGGGSCTICEQAAEPVALLQPDLCTIENADDLAPPAERIRRAAIFSCAPSQLAQMRDLFLTLANVGLLQN